MNRSIFLNLLYTAQPQQGPSLVEVSMVTMLHSIIEALTQDDGEVVFPKLDP